MSSILHTSICRFTSSNPWANRVFFLFFVIDAMDAIDLWRGTCVLGFFTTRIFLQKKWTFFCPKQHTHTDRHGLVVPVWDADTCLETSNGDVSGTVEDDWVLAI
jgi:hypothetical protein